MAEDPSVELEVDVETVPAGVPAETEDIWACAESVSTADVPINAGCPLLSGFACVVEATEYPCW